MNSPRTGLRVASIVFAIFGLGHILRLVNQARVTVGTYDVPMAASIIALLIAAALCIWFWRLSSRAA